MTFIGSCEAGRKVCQFMLAAVHSEQPHFCSISRRIMAKKSSQRRKQQSRETNWVVIGGLIALGVVVFGILIYLALRSSEAEPVQALSAYCAENSDRCAVIGEADAPVTLVEVSDFGCPHCESFHAETATPLREQYVDTGTMRWIAMPYALGNTTVPAAASAMCANEQDRYFEYANALFAITPAQTRLTADGYRQAAETVGLDLDQFGACMDDGRYLSIVNDNRDAARRVQVTGTPTFFLNDEKLEGAQPLSAFAQAISQVLGAQ
jgi:protein-disulfide isomerase